MICFIKNNRHREDDGYFIYRILRFSEILALKMTALQLLEPLILIFHMYCRKKVIDQDSYRGNHPEIKRRISEID